jgi:ABC-type multidrug transport system fused ATPase/permease subunit
MFKSISVFCNFREKILIIFFFILQFIISFIEFLTLSLIPIFILYVHDPEKAIIKLEQLKNYFTTNFFLLEINNLILVAFIFIIFALIIKNFLQVLNIFLEAYLVKILTYSNTNKVFTNFINQNLFYIISKRSAEIVRIISTDVSKAIGYFMCTLLILKDTIFLIAIFITIFFNNKNIGVFTFILVLFWLLLNLRFIKTKLVNKGKKSLKSTTNIIESITNFIGTIKEIKIYRIEAFFLNYFLNNLKVKLKNDMFKHIVSKIQKNIFEVFLVILICLTLYFLNYSANESHLLLPTLGLFVVSMFRIIPILSTINQSYAGLKYNEAIYINIKNYFNSFNVNNKVNFQYEKKHLIKKFKKLYFKNLNFSYEKIKLFENFEFIIKKNVINGVIGKSGSGKSTLLNIIIGLIKPQSVDIEVDKRNLKNTNYKLDGVIGYVPQDVFLINGTILENITLGIEKKKIDVKRVVNVAKDACVINMFKDSNLTFDSILTDRGTNLSGGQRQRIGIARALYRKPKYLLLDEATNQLDKKTKLEIFKNIKLKYKNLTTIIVSHDKDLEKFCENKVNLDI